MMIARIPAQEQDTACMTALRKEIRPTAYRGIYPDEAIEHFDFSTHQKRDLAKIRDKSYSVFLICAGGAPIGYFLFQRQAAALRLHSLYVLREYQHQGIGKQAFAMLRSYHSGTFAGPHRLVRQPHNENALRFYRRMGGTIIHVDTGNANPQEDQVKFVLFL